MCVLTCYGAGGFPPLASRKDPDAYSVGVLSLGCRCCLGFVLRSRRRTARAALAATSCADRATAASPGHDPAASPQRAGGPRASRTHQRRLSAAAGCSRPAGAPAATSCGRLRPAMPRRLRLRVRPLCLGLQSALHDR